MVTFWFLIAVLVCVASAWQSRDRALEALAGLLALSFFACNVINRVGEAAEIFGPPVRMALYVLIDTIWIPLVLWTCNSAPQTRPLRWPLGFLFITGLCLHVLILVTPVIDHRFYYASLNVLFALKFLTVTAAGVDRVVARLLQGRGGAGAHFRHMVHDRNDR